MALVTSEVDVDVETPTTERRMGHHSARKYHQQLDEDQQALQTQEGKSDSRAVASHVGASGSCSRWSKGTKVAALSSAVVLFVTLGLLSSFLLVQPARKRVETYGSLTGDRELRFEQVFHQPHPSADVGAREDGSLSFLVVGDWGRDGGYGQGDVALAMAQVAEDVRPEFVVSTGDNFYLGGLAGVDDQQFETSFSSIYNHTSLQVPWLSVLGNHDYGDSGGCGLPVEQDDVSCLSKSKQMSRSPLHQMNPDLRLRDWRWFCERYYTYKPKQLLAGSSQVDLLFIDTSPFIESYRNRTWAKTVAGGIATQSSVRQKAFIENFLQKSNAKRKLVIGHHPFYSNGYRGSNSELQRELGEIFDKYNVTMYLNGHDHDLQHVHPQGVRTHFFTSGAGSKTGRGFGTRNTRFEYDSPGFAAVLISKDLIRVRFHDANANLLYEQEI